MSLGGLWLSAGRQAIELPYPARGRSEDILRWKWKRYRSAVDMTREDCYSEGTVGRYDLYCPPVGAPFPLDILVRSRAPMGRTKVFIRKRAVLSFKFLLRDLAETPEFSIEHKRDDLERKGFSSAVTSQPPWSETNLILAVMLPLVLSRTTCCWFVNLS